MRLGTFTWQLPNHRKKRKERRQRRKTKKEKKKTVHNSLLFIIKTRKWKELEQARGNKKHSDQFLPPAVFCGGSDPRRNDGWVEALRERARGKDDHCAAGVAGIFLSKGKQVGASFTLDAAGGRFSDDLSSFFSGNQSPLWKSWNVGLVLLPPLFTYPRVPPRISWQLCQNETLEDKLENAVSSSSGRTGGVTFLKEVHNS